MRFLVQVEFQTHGGVRFWFPSVVTCAEPEGASRFADAVAKGLGEHYSVKAAFQPRAIIKRISSDSLDELRLKRTAGQPRLLEVRLWGEPSRSRAIGGMVALSAGSVVERTTVPRSFPVWEVGRESPLAGTEPLFLDVELPPGLAPDDVEPWVAVDPAARGGSPQISS